MGVQLITFVRKIVAATIAYKRAGVSPRPSHFPDCFRFMIFPRVLSLSSAARAMITLEFLSPKLAFRSSSSSWWLEKSHLHRAASPIHRAAGRSSNFAAAKGNGSTPIKYFFPIVSVHLANRKVESGCRRFVFPLCPRRTSGVYSREEPN